MNELIDQFCESRRRWLIVTAVTALLGLATVVPLVDDYSTLCDENNGLANQLDDINRVTAGLPAFRKRVGKKLAELDGIEQQTVSEERVSGFRNRLIGYVRDSGCRVHRISVGSSRDRNWHKQDNAIEVSPPKSPDNPATAFVLQTRPVTLSVAGSIAGVKKLLGRIQQDEMMLHTKAFELYPTGKRRSSVHMDLELWCFALGRKSG